MRCKCVCVCYIYIYILYYRKKNRNKASNWCGTCDTFTEKKTLTAHTHTLHTHLAPLEQTRQYVVCLWWWWCGGGYCIWKTYDAEVTGCLVVDIFVSLLPNSFSFIHMYIVIVFLVLWFWIFFMNLKKSYVCGFFYSLFNLLNWK